MANRDPDPVVLELATLPREQIGPFLLLGLDKDADKDQIEASWADRVKGARKTQIKVPLEDVNWAREILNDTARRIRADVTSLNIDTADGVVSQLEKRYGVAGRTGKAGRCATCEKPLADYTPPAEMPDRRGALGHRRARGAGGSACPVASHGGTGSTTTRSLGTAARTSRRPIAIRPTSVRIRTHERATSLPDSYRTEPVSSTPLPGRKRAAMRESIIPSAPRRSSGSARSHRPARDERPPAQAVRADARQDARRRCKPASTASPPTRSGPTSSSARRLHGEKRFSWPCSTSCWRSASTWSTS